jgi:tetraacyldisaccharide 4'-kinase
MPLLSFFLLPFAWLYAGVMAVRNWLYDKGIKEGASFSVPVISVGNLRVGGTGKTPHVAWVVRELLAQGEKPAVLSRGYGQYLRHGRYARRRTIAALPGFWRGRTHCSVRKPPDRHHDPRPAAT